MVILACPRLSVASPSDPHKRPVLPECSSFDLPAVKQISESLAKSLDCNVEKMQALLALRSDLFIEELSEKGTAGPGPLAIVGRQHYTHFHGRS
jgi:hypothetical protein